MRKHSIIIFAMVIVLILGCGVSMAAELTIGEQYHTDAYSAPTIEVTYDTDGADAVLKVWVNDLLVIDGTVNSSDPKVYSEPLSIQEWNSLGAQEGKYTITGTLVGTDFSFSKKAILYADWNPPVISNPNPADNAFVSSLTNFSVTITDAGTGVDKAAVSLAVLPEGPTISGPQVVGDRYTWTISNVSDNTYTFTVTAADNVPSPHTVEETFKVTLDKTAPVVPVTSGPNDTADNSPANTGFTWTVSEANPARYAVLVNGSEAFSIDHDEAVDAGMVTGSAPDWTVEFNGDINGDNKQDVFLENGKYTVVLKVKDAAGNEGQSDPNNPESTFVFDNVAPEYTAGALPVYVGPSTDFTLTFKDAVAGFEGDEQIMIWAYGPDNKLIENWPKSITITPNEVSEDSLSITLPWASIAEYLGSALKDGDSFTIKVLAHDRLGNPDGNLGDAEKEALAKVLTSTWDNTAPEITAPLASASKYDITRLKLTYKAKDEISGLGFAKLQILDEVNNTSVFEGDTEKNPDVIYLTSDGVELNLASLYGKELLKGNSYKLNLTVYDGAGNEKTADPVTITVAVIDGDIDFNVQDSKSVSLSGKDTPISRMNEPELYLYYNPNVAGPIDTSSIVATIDGTPVEHIVMSGDENSELITIIPGYNLADGIHEFKISFKIENEPYVFYDGAFEFGIDTTAPVVTQVTKEWDGKSPVKVKVVDNLVGVGEVQMGIADYTGMLKATPDPEDSSIYTIKFGPTFAEGTYTLNVAYVDAIGNWNMRAFELTVGAPPAPVEDKVAPTVEGEIKDGTLKITATDNVALDRVVVTVGDESTTYSVSGTKAIVDHTLPTKIGLYNIQIVAYDKAGNASAPWTTPYKVRPKYEPGKSSGFGWDMWKY
ncbi:MAG: hypothetical protein HPY71_14980 [Firmicutes bacterium]|nr:hypothetical protein [Bacillota bacterium]